jgi:hypothetical protein
LTRSAPYEKSKSLGSGGSMVARLKLKEIDGRAPPGVNNRRCLPQSTLRPRAARKGEVAGLEQNASLPLQQWGATRPNCGKLLKSPSLPSQRPKGADGHVNRVGYGQNDSGLDDPQPSP